MFQTGRRPQPELPPAYRPDDPRKGSKWRPTLQRIRRGIFSRKRTPRPVISSPNQSLPLNEVNQQPLNQRTRPSTEGREGRNPFYRCFRKESQTTSPPECPQSPPELNDSKGNNFFRRTLTKSNREEESSTKEHARPQQHKRRHTDLARPISTAYVPTGKPVEQEPLLQRPSTAAYIPQHAATDFRRMSNYGPQFDGYASLDEQLGTSSLQPGHPVTIRTAAFEPDDDGDYQNFLAQSRAEAARTLESSGLRSPNKIMPTEGEKIMGEIEANYRAAARDRPRPTSSTSKRVSRSGSFFEKVGEYYKPVETGVAMKDENSGIAVRDQAAPVLRRASRRSTAARPVSRSESFFRGVGEYIKPSNPDHHPGGVNNPQTGPTGYLTAGDAQDRQAKRWSMISGTSRRSVSQERDGDWDADGRAARGSWMSDGTLGRKRSTTMPTSPGLDRYNQGVRKGVY